MADDVRRWSVTYTKHIKQKRKVYQDGFLEIQSSSHKVKLYDDCDKLLESKIVKLDDAVRSGETVTLGAYLVDIGDPHGDIKPIPNLILQRDKTIADRAHISNTKTSKVRPHIGKASSINLSPSQKIIREFKRREVKKYCSPPSCPDTTKDDSTEWEVLYTTQLTQKAKKFHDGILRVAISGLRGRQAVLYDETRKQLDSRFLRNEELITGGESLKFDGHLVDVIELKDHKPLKDTNVNGRNCHKQNTLQSKIHNEHLSEFKKHETNKSSAYFTKTNLAEWDIMYTTQVTQKAKKFHDGVLKLASSGSHGREEATLLAEDGTVLSHRYLKLSEEINSGSLFNMSNYLVEIGEPRKCSEGEGPRKDSKLENETLKIRSFDADNIKLSKRIPASRPLSDGEPLKEVVSLQDDDSKARSFVQDKVISMPISKNKPLRDANSILSILRKPRAQEGVDIEKQQDSSEVAFSNEETHDYKGPISNFNAVDTAISLSPDSDIMLDKQQKDTKHGSSFGLETSSVCDMEFDFTIKNRPSPPTEEPQAFGVNLKGLPSTGAVEISCKATATSNFNEPAKETRHQSNTQISGDNMKTNSDGNVGAVPTTLSCNHYDKTKDFKNTNSRNSDFPSFDLGFD